MIKNWVKIRKKKKKRNKAKDIQPVLLKSKVKNPKKKKMVDQNKGIRKDLESVASRRRKRNSINIKNVVTVEIANIRGIVMRMREAVVERNITKRKKKKEIDRMKEKTTGILYDS